MAKRDENRKLYPRPRGAALISLLPLWLLSAAVTVEGFPKPPISLSAAITCLAAAVLLALFLLLRGWVTLELVLFSALPLMLVSFFDEITTTYKTPFILACAAVLSAGMLLYQRSRAPRAARTAFLVLSAALMLFAADHARGAFWRMTEALGYVQCFPDYTGCPPLTGSETPWWQLFFWVT